MSEALPCPLLVPPDQATRRPVVPVTRGGGPSDAFLSVVIARTWMHSESGTRKRVYRAHKWPQSFLAPCYLHGFPGEQCQGRWRRGLRSRACVLQPCRDFQHPGRPGRVPFAGQAVWLRLRWRGARWVQRTPAQPRLPAHVAPLASSSKVCRPEKGFSVILVKCRWMRSGQSSDPDFLRGLRREVSFWTSELDFYLW